MAAAGCRNREDSEDALFLCEDEASERSDNKYRNLEARHRRKKSGNFVYLFFKMRYFKSAMSCSTKGTFNVVKKQTYQFTQFYAPDS